MKDSTEFVGNARRRHFYRYNSRVCKNGKHLIQCSIVRNGFLLFSVERFEMTADCETCAEWTAKDTKLSERRKHVF